MREEALKWWRQALADLRKAENALTTRDYDAVAFWSHQAAEKALKALLISRGITARGNDLVRLAELVQEELGLDISSVVDALRELTIHYTVSRYPDAANAVPCEIYTESKARYLLDLARQVVRWVEQYLQLEVR